jgi:hypothetical protein
VNKSLKLLCLAGLLTASAQLQATGLATCDSGPEDTWKPKSELEKVLTDKGWTVRNIKVDGGCYEVYALDENGEKVEAYFHPQTLEPVALDTEEGADEAKDG